MKNIDFDGGEWDDFIEIKLFGETHKIRLGTWNDSLKMKEIQKELIKLKEDDPKTIKKTIGFLVNRFNEAGAGYTEKQFMNLAPAKTIAILRTISQGDPEELPLEPEAS